MSKSKVEEMALANGYVIAESGGGFAALRNDCGSRYVLITQENDPGLPETENEPVAVGLYDESDDYDTLALEVAPNLEAGFEVALRLLRKP